MTTDKSGTWDTAIELGQANDADGYDWHQVFANKKSVNRDEFYKAAQSGLKPQLSFEVHTFEFDETKDEKLRYPAGSDGTIYHILRAYDKPDEKTEITVT